MSTSNRGTKRPLTRVSRACQECRKRKVRCSFESPCGTCRQYNVPCIYREFARPRRKIGHSAAAANAISEMGEVESVDTHVDGASRIYINTPQALIRSNGIAASHQSNVEAPVHLFYGSSCSFSFLEQLHRDLHSIDHSAFSDTGHEDIRDASVIIGEYSFRTLFFGSRQVYDKTSILPCLQLLASMPRVIASGFLESFTTTNYPFCPILPVEEFSKLFDLIVGNRVEEYILNFRVYLLMFALALGALNLGNKEWKTLLVKEADKALLANSEAVNVEIIQCHLLSAHLLAEQGDFNAAYLALGTTVRKAVAGGLHTRVNGPHSEQIHTVIWAIYHFEAWLSHTLGRPASLPCDLIDHEMPSSTDMPLLLSLVEFSKILETYNTRLDRPRRGSVSEMWEDAQAGYESLQILKHRFEKRFAFQMTDLRQATDWSYAQITIFTFYNHILYATFRPFLILERRWRNYLRNLNTERPRPSYTPRAFTRARQIAIQAAREQIACVSSAIKTSSVPLLTQNIRHFMEEACFILIYSLIDSTDKEGADTSSIEVAVKTVLASDRKAAFPEFPSMIRKLVAAIVSLKQPNKPLCNARGTDDLSTFSRLQISIEDSGFASETHAEGIPVNSMDMLDDLHRSSRLVSNGPLPSYIDTADTAPPLFTEAGVDTLADLHSSLDPFFGAASMDIDFSTVWTSELDFTSAGWPT